MNDTPTYPITDDVLQASAVQVSKATNCGLCDAVNLCETCTGTALAVLTIAVPMLGTTRTEYSVRIGHRGAETYVLADQERSHIHTERSEAEKTVDRLRNGWTKVDVVERTVIASEWK